MMKQGNTVVQVDPATASRFGGLAGGRPRGEGYEGVEAAVQADLQTRSEAGEAASRLIAGIASMLATLRHRLAPQAKADLEDIAYYLVLYRIEG